MSNRLHDNRWKAVASRVASAAVLAGPLGLALAAALAIAAAADPAAAKVRVAASINDLSSIAASVGGAHVEVVAIARPASDPHRVEVLPSYMVRVARAQLYLKVGLDLDRWAAPIIDGSQNSKLVVLDCSKDVRVLEKPTGRVDASMGDVHVQGNPHYWLDPRNAAIVARTIADALARIDPANANAYGAGAMAFADSARAFVARGLERAAALPNRELITYHRSWSYFADTFGFNVVSTIEPVPGIPPTARHLQELVQIVKERKVQVVLQEPYFSNDAGAFLQREAGARVVVSSASCADVVAGSYLQHLDDVLTMIARPPGR